MKEVTCPSGAVLKILPSPFAAAKALYQAVLREARGIDISSATELPTLYKNLFCAGFSSPEIDRCLWECLKRCTYNKGDADHKITDQTFEPLEARDDYMVVCLEVAKANILPFAKSLYAEYQRVLSTAQSTQA